MPRYARSRLWRILRHARSARMVKVLKQDGLVNGFRLGGIWRHEIESASDIGLHISAMHHSIKHSVLNQELAGLEAFRQFLADGLLDHARTSEADQRSRLGNVQIAQHGV